MKSLLKILATIGLLGVSALAVADDSAPTRDTQAMKDCLAKQKASNSSMTQAAMETVCKNETAKG